MFDYTKNKRAIELTLLLVLVCVGGALYFYFINSQNLQRRQVILIGIDGMQDKHFLELYNSGKLSNFNKLIGKNGYVGTVEITGHSNTETAPGNAELLTGLSSKVTKISENGCDEVISRGLTVFERLKAYDGNIVTGLLYGKGTCYIPGGILQNAKSSVDWWNDRTSYPQKTYVSNNCADSSDVATKATEFFRANKDKDFFFEIYFGVLDCVGHKYGENSPQYDEAFANIDTALGTILKSLADQKIAPEILLSADHGWNEGAKGHSTNRPDTAVIPFLTNDASLVGADSRNEAAVKKQCDIVPAIYRLFSVPEKTYSDVLTGGCGR